MTLQLPESVRAEVRDGLFNILEASPATPSDRYFWGVLMLAKHVGLPEKAVERIFGTNDNFEAWCLLPAQAPGAHTRREVLFALRMELDRDIAKEHMA